MIRHATQTSNLRLKSSEALYSLFVPVGNYQLCASIRPELRSEPGTIKCESNILPIELSERSAKSSWDMKAIVFLGLASKFWYDGFVLVTILNKDETVVKCFSGFQWQTGCSHCIKNRWENHIHHRPVMEFILPHKSEQFASVFNKLSGITRKCVGRRSKCYAYQQLSLHNYNLLRTQIPMNWISGIRSSCAASKHWLDANSERSELIQTRSLEIVTSCWGFKRLGNTVEWNQFHPNLSPTHCLTA